MKEQKLFLIGIGVSILFLFSFRSLRVSGNATAQFAIFSNQVENEINLEQPAPAATAAATTTMSKQEKFYQRHYESLDLNNTELNDLLSWVTGYTGGPGGPGFLHGILKSLPHYSIEDPPGLAKPKGKLNTRKVIPLTLEQEEARVAIYKERLKNKGKLTAMEIPYQDNNNNSPQAKHIIHIQAKSGLCKAAKFFKAYREHPKHKNKPWPHINILGMHRDFGALSQYMEHYTYQSNHRVKEWKAQGCSVDFIKEYIDHPDTVAIITTQYHIWDHPKCHSIPLGMKGIESAQTALTYLSQKAGIKPPTSEASPKPPLHNRPQLVMVNFKDWKQLEDPLHSRHRLMRHLQSDQFSYPNGTRLQVYNTYIKPKLQVHTDGYYAELMGSKFIFSPSGWGIDCYRNWEALYAGTIPVLETMNRQDGWFRTMDDLPIAWIDHYENVTPQWLEDEYERIMDKWDSYNWEKMTRHFWVNWVLSLASAIQEG